MASSTHRASSGLGGDSGSVSYAGDRRRSSSTYTAFAPVGDNQVDDDDGGDGDGDAAAVAGAVQGGSGSTIDSSGPWAPSLLLPVNMSSWTTAHLEGLTHIFVDGETLSTSHQYRLAADCYTDPTLYPLYSA